MLLRKKQFIKRIEVNPKSYALHLFGKDETRISKNILSAGEKQVFAIAILWALSKVSGREIPIIIDTPLARLDSNHRHNLVTNYFPKAGKQVIIFTTDTEIDKQSYRLLEDKVARSYFLMSKNGEPSVIKHGYFSF
jgi:DNA sulfur modification protein DndD